MTRAERRARTQRIVQRRQKFARLWRKDSNPGRWRKRHPLDCGCPRCVYCHSEKVFGKPRRYDLLAEEERNEHVISEETST